MKSSLICPKCRSRRLWQIEEVRQLQPGNIEAMVMSVTAVDGNVEAGRFEAWVCAECGFTEWYAKEANAELARLAAFPYSGVRLIDTTAQCGPFR
jgi:predicted nucleic-acid-binding Zn-ribbon protein